MRRSWGKTEAPRVRRCDQTCEERRMFLGLEFYQCFLFDPFPDMTCTVPWQEQGCAAANVHHVQAPVRRPKPIPGFSRVCRHLVPPVGRESKVLDPHAPFPERFGSGCQLQTRRNFIPHELPVDLSSGSVCRLPLFRVGQFNRYRTPFPRVSPGAASALSSYGPSRACCGNY